LTHSAAPQIYTPAHAESLRDIQNWKKLVEELILREAEVFIPECIGQEGPHLLSASWGEWA
jgi:hypothetical protein